MKKIAAAILLLLSFSGFSSLSQNTSCNAAFNITYVNGNTIQFNPINTGTAPATQHFWFFGDGATSTLIAPVHSYSGGSVFTVEHRIYRMENGTAVCHDSVFMVVQVQTSCNLTANFYAYHDSTVSNPYAFHFENTSAPLNNTDSIRWTFGDGTASNQLSPNHSYTQPGTYNVCLRIQKRETNGTLTNCVSELCHQIVVSPVNTCTLLANFNFYPDSLSTVPNSFHFVNTTVPLNTTDSVRWTFGDGTSSNQFNPNHAYSQAGTYNVCLRVQKREANGTLLNCVSDICHTIVVATACNLQVHYTSNADSVNHRIIYFHNQSVSPSAAATAYWTFGDGSSSSVWNPVHEYAQPGRYLVCLKIQVSNTCVSTTCDSVTVTGNEPNCLQQSNFSIIPVAGNTHLFYFAPMHVDNTIQYTWSFGDGTGSQNTTVSHLYTQAGNYTVCLTAYRNANCASTTCRPVIIANSYNCDSAHINYTWQPDSLYPNRVHFYTLTNTPVASETWTIRRLPVTATSAIVTLNQYNPIYVFTDTGHYQVCLRAVTASGCIKEVCNIVNITQVQQAPGCNLQLYPNPATNTINVNVLLNQPQMLDLYIYNNLNVLVKQKHQAGVAGNNIISTNIETLVPGVYTIRLVHGNDVCYAQFVKL